VRLVVPPFPFFFLQLSSTEFAAARFADEVTGISVGFSDLPLFPLPIDASLNGITHRFFSASTPHASIPTNSLLAPSAHPCHSFHIYRCYILITCRSWTEGGRYPFFPRSVPGPPLTDRPSCFQSKKISEYLARAVIAVFCPPGRRRSPSAPV